MKKKKIEKTHTKKQQQKTHKNTIVKTYKI